MFSSVSSIAILLRGSQAERVQRTRFREITTEREHAVFPSHDNTGKRAAEQQRDTFGDCIGACVAKCEHVAFSQIGKLDVAHEHIVGRAQAAGDTPFERLAAIRRIGIEWVSIAEMLDYGCLHAHHAAEVREVVDATIHDAVAHGVARFQVIHGGQVRATFGSEEPSHLDGQLHACRYILQRAVRGEQYIYSFSGDAMIEMHQLLLRILEEIHSSSYARDSYIAVLIQQLLLDINRGAYAETHVDENEREADLLERLLAYIDSLLDEDLTLDQIADDLYVSKYYASHVVKQQLGLSLHQYILQKRLRQCALELAQGRPVTKVYLAHGFHDYSSFFRAFKKMYSLPPKDYQDVYQKDPARLDAVD